MQWYHKELFLIKHSVGGQLLQHAWHRCPPVICFEYRKTRCFTSKQSPEGFWKSIEHYLSIFYTFSLPKENSQTVLLSVQDFLHMVLLVIPANTPTLVSVLHIDWLCRIVCAAVVTIGNEWKVNKIASWPVSLCKCTRPILCSICDVVLTLMLLPRLLLYSIHCTIGFSCAFKLSCPCRKTVTFSSKNVM